MRYVQLSSLKALGRRFRQGAKVTHRRSEIARSTIIIKSVLPHAFFHCHHARCQALVTLVIQVVNKGTWFASRHVTRLELSSSRALPIFSDNFYFRTITAATIRQSVGVIVTN